MAISPQHLTCPLVALTGGIASGKSLTSQLFSEHGVRVIDTDIISHTLTQAEGLALPEIVSSFGEQALDTTGALNRTYMRELIFNDLNAKLRLEAILHPLIFQHALAQCAAISEANIYQILVVPLLLETQHYLPYIRRILVIDCPVSLQITRTMQRNHLSQHSAKKIIAQQTSREQRLAAADDVIHNEGDIQCLHTQVAALHQVYMRLFS